MTVIKPSPQTPGRIDWIINCTLYKIWGPDKSFFLTSPKQGFASFCSMKGVAWFRERKFWEIPFLILIRPNISQGLTFMKTNIHED